MGDRVNPRPDDRQQMAQHIARHLQEGAELRQQIGEDVLGQAAAAADAILRALRAGHKVLFCGNGGSASQAQHLAGEFTGRFLRERRGLPAIALNADTAALTAIGNDYGFERVFARQVEALGQPGDVLFGLSTSGNSPNVVEAARVARERRIVVVALTGPAGGKVADHADVCVRIPSRATPLIQEMHLAIGHAICDLVEAAVAE